MGVNNIEHGEDIWQRVHIGYESISATVSGLNSLAKYIGQIQKHHYPVLVCVYEVVATHFLSAKSSIFIIVTTPKWRVCVYFASFLDLAKLPRVPLTVGIIQQYLTLMSLRSGYYGNQEPDYFTEGDGGGGGGGGGGDEGYIVAVWLKETGLYCCGGSVMIWVMICVPAHISPPFVVFQDREHRGFVKRTSAPLNV